MKKSHLVYIFMHYCTVVKSISKGGQIFQSDFPFEEPEKLLKPRSLYSTSQYFHIGTKNVTVYFIKRIILHALLHSCQYYTIRVIQIAIYIHRDSSVLLISGKILETNKVYVLCTIHICLGSRVTFMSSIKTFSTSHHAPQKLLSIFGDSLLRNVQVKYEFELKKII